MSRSMPPKLKPSDFGPQRRATSSASQKFRRHSKS
jgi:hypothetical protein